MYPFGLDGVTASPIMPACSCCGNAVDRSTFRVVVDDKRVSDALEGTVAYPEGIIPDLAWICSKCAVETLRCEECGGYLTGIPRLWFIDDDGLVTCNPYCPGYGQPPIACLNKMCPRYSKTTVDAFLAGRTSAVGRQGFPDPYEAILGALPIDRGELQRNHIESLRNPLRVQPGTDHGDESMERKRMPTITMPLAGLLRAHLSDPELRLGLTQLLQHHKLHMRWEEDRVILEGRAVWRLREAARDFLALDQGRPPLEVPLPDLDPVNPARLEAIPAASVEGGTERIRLYLDVDGVLLGKNDPSSPDIALARWAQGFLEFALGTFECYWLTTHCKGESAPVLEYLRPHCTPYIRKLLAEIRPTYFRTLKTEALAGDFYWLDDSPLVAEKEWLRAASLEDRWIEVNTRLRPDDLGRAMGELRRRLKGRVG